MKRRMQQHTLAKLGLGAAILLTAGGIVARSLTRASLSPLQTQTYQPTHDYASALQRFAHIQIEEATNPQVNPICRSRL